MKTQIVEMSPCMAKQILANNIGNRNLRKNTVDAYSRSMKAGEWKLTHQGVAIYEDGVIADGQHRLHAVVDSGVTIPVLLTTGLARDSSEALDQGAQRTIYDALNISGHSWATKSSVAILSAMIRYGQKSGKSSLRLTPSDILAYKQKVGDVVCREYLIMSRRYCSATVKAAVACAVVDGYASDEDADRFMSVVSSGLPDTKGDVGALLLRDFLISHRNTGSGQMQLTQVFLRTQRALKAFIDGEQIARLRLPQGQLWYAPDFYSRADV